MGRANADPRCSTTKGRQMNVAHVPLVAIAGGIGIGLAANATHKAADKQVKKIDVWGDGSETKKFVRTSSDGFRTSSELVGKPALAAALVGFGATVGSAFAPPALRAGIHAGGQGLLLAGLAANGVAAFDRN